MEAASERLSRASFLNVETSAGGKRWEERLADPRRGLALAQRLDLPEIVGRILAARDVDLDSAEAYLNPTLRQFLPDPSHLRDMDQAVERLVKAIREGERIAVFGDYDVDGATSSALLHRFLKQAGADLRVYIPDRITEGYGPNATALRQLRSEGIAVVITVDCGITSFDALEDAADQGLEVIVVDHHAAEPRLPVAAAVVNPNRQDEESDCGHLAAVGVTFLLIVALNRGLRQAGWFQQSGLSEPDLKQWLDLVALGTVCDVVPLYGLNRAFVTQGLKVMGQRKNPGLVALSDVAKLSERPDSFHLGFMLGPRVNAGGRVGEAGLGATLLATDDAVEARDLASRLDRYNAERKELEAQVLDQAIEQVEANGEPPGGLVIAAGPNWHPGVIGIVASRLKDRYNAPAIVIALDEKGLGKGSGRSVPGVDLGATVIAARQAGLLINGGGHPMAAGLTVAADALKGLEAFLTERITSQLKAVDYRPSLGIDGALQPGGATADLLREIERCGPFGVGNPQPRFVLPSVQVANASVVGADHVRCSLAGVDGKRIKGIAFRALDNPLGELLLKSGGVPLHVAGKLKLDSWAGRDAVQIIIEDAASI
ncbi:single-stranded-DNA-specific exonuclease RecJ [Pelagibius sp. Alg239-R121]|uniref:single-stranded-DNA-specific exonuclease RecJ n=1 Tax=Pelagibius sp. Alg239-R121 TaxID=2993448 RepID=UPI0024A6F7A2|nr:single-stranded-DNA-specific exonuclease RecJ [Pelagibius sp. Alg239-R121]